MHMHATKSNIGGHMVHVAAHENKLGIPAGTEGDYIVQSHVLRTLNTAQMHNCLGG